MTQPLIEKMHRIGQKKRTEIERPLSNKEKEIIKEIEMQRKAVQNATKNTKN